MLLAETLEFRGRGGGFDSFDFHILKVAWSRLAHR